MTREAVLGLHLDDVQWEPMAQALGDGDRPPSGWIAVLSSDAETGATTVLFKLPAGFDDGLTESHRVVQELVLLTGDFAMADIEMRPGTYFCVPPGMVHGPGRSRGGAVLLSMLGGPFAMTYHEGLEQGDFAPEA
jgi:hypothetical protein